MELPIASYLLNAAGLSVTFTDTSANLPDSWLWSFGDTGTSTAQNPTHVYAADGSYTVTLTATNTTGSSTLTRQLIFTALPGFNDTIGEMVQRIINMGLYDIYAAAKVWQLYIQPMMKPAIADADVFNELKWPPLANVLISKLIIYEQILAVAGQVAASLGIATSNSSTGASGADNVKYIETGPARTEWFDSSESITNLFKQTPGIPNSGVLGQITTDLCGYAQRLRIKLPMCTLITDTPTFKKGPCFPRFRLG